jgi:hypothetical protein
MLVIAAVKATNVSVELPHTRPGKIIKDTDRKRPPSCALSW